MESLKQRRWYRKLCLFLKIYKNQSPKQLSDIILQSSCQYITRNAHNIPHVNVKHKFFKNSYFSTIIEWNKLGSNIRNSEILNIFQFIRLITNSIFGCHNPIGVKLHTRLRLGLSHLCKDKLKHGFQDTFISFCSCGKEVKTTFHFLLSCLTYWAKDTGYQKIWWTTFSAIPSISYDNYKRIYLIIKECIGNCFKVIHWFILKIGLERKAEMGKHVGTMVLVNIF